MSNTHWDHYERYTSVFGSVSKEEGGEWIARVSLKNRKDHQQARLKETFISASAAMSAVVRTWQRENGTDKQPVVAKLVKSRSIKDRIRLIAETIAGPGQMVGHMLEIIVKADDTGIEALYELLRQVQLDRNTKGGDNLKTLELQDEVDHLVNRKEIAK